MRCFFFFLRLSSRTDVLLCYLYLCKRISGCGPIFLAGAKQRASMFFHLCSPIHRDSMDLISRLLKHRGIVLADEADLGFYKTLEILRAGMDITRWYITDAYPNRFFPIEIRFLFLWTIFEDVSSRTKHIIRLYVSLFSWGLHITVYEA